MTYEEQLQRQTLMKAAGFGDLLLARRLFKQLKKMIRDRKRAMTR